MTVTQRANRRVPVLSPTLEINERIRALREQGRRVVHLAFGEAGLPVADELLDALRASAAENAYGSVSGSVELRESVAGYFSRRGLASEPRQVMVGPGSKSLLYGTVLAIDGDVVVPKPSWVSYQPQVLLVGREPIDVTIPASAGGVPEPELLRDRIEQARRAGGVPRALIITQPDNPTGTIADRSLLEQVVSVAREHDLWLVADEIYRDLAFDQSSYTSVAELAPERTIVTSGLSKSLALGGWRIGALRVPDTAEGLALLGEVSAVGSEIWSCMAAPIASAAMVGFSDTPAIADFIARARQLHAKVSLTVFEIFNTAGVACRRPQAGFYMYPDLVLARPFLSTKGVTTDQELAAFLLDRYQVAVLPGSAFGDDGNALRFRVATSLLYGATADERRASLDWAAADDATVPDRLADDLRVLQRMVDDIVRSA